MAADGEPERAGEDSPHAWAAEAGAVAHALVDALGDDAFLDGDVGHHLARVRRLRADELVTLADGAGSWRPYRVSEVARGRIVLEARGSVRREPTLVPRLAVAFALTKGDRPDQVVQKLTELGVDRIVPVLARRSVVRWDEDRAHAATERLRRVGREAVEQCRRATLPVVEAPVSSGALAGHPAVLVADRGGGPVEALGPPPGGEWLVVVGPEGGLEADEVAALTPRGRLGVGPHVLRSETAAVAVAAVLCGTRAVR